MFGKLFSSLRASNNNDEFVARRKHTRREHDHCIVIVNGNMMPVKNWSLGGVLVDADDRSFTQDDIVDVVMRFKLSSKIIDVPHSARVVRKGANRVALEFKPLTQQIRSNFQNVVDDYVASQFASSQRFT